jgi:TolA-binding protein
MKNKLVTIFLSLSVAFSLMTEASAAITPGATCSKAGIKQTYKGKTYSKNGYFLIDDVQLEQNNANANHSTLKQLAIQSNGKYRFLKDYEKTLEEIASRDDIAAVQYEEKAFLSLIDLNWLLGFLVALASLEWFLRRFKGSY